MKKDKEVYDWSDPGAGKTTVSEPAARTVLNAYTSDANGNQVNTDSNYVTIEMYVSPSEGHLSFIIWLQDSIHGVHHTIYMFH